MTDYQMKMAAFELAIKSLAITPDTPTADNIRAEAEKIYKWLKSL